MKFSKWIILYLLLASLLWSCTTITNEEILASSVEEQLISATDNSNENINESISFIDFLKELKFANRISSIQYTIYGPSENIQILKKYSYNDQNQLSKIVEHHYSTSEYDEYDYTILFFYDTLSIASDDEKYDLLPKYLRFYIDSSNNRIISKFSANNENIQYDLDLKNNKIQLLRGKRLETVDRLNAISLEMIGYYDEELYNYGFDYYYEIDKDRYHIQGNDIFINNEDKTISLDLKIGKDKFLEKSISLNDEQLIQSSITFRNQKESARSVFYKINQYLFSIETYRDDKLILKRDLTFDENESNINYIQF